MATRFHGLLQKKVEEAIQARTASVIAGQCIDYSIYKENVGYINGLIDSLKLCDEVEQDMGNERSGSAPGN
jgi:hypothetical protein